MNATGQQLLMCVRACGVCVPLLNLKSNNTSMTTAAQASKDPSQKFPPPRAREAPATWRKSSPAPSLLPSHCPRVTAFKLLSIVALFIQGKSACNSKQRQFKTHNSTQGQYNTHTANTRKHQSRVWYGDALMDPTPQPLTVNPLYKAMNGIEHTDTETHTHIMLVRSTLAPPNARTH